MILGYRNKSDMKCSWNISAIVCEFKSGSFVSVVDLIFFFFGGGACALHMSHFILHNEIKE